MRTVFTLSTLLCLAAATDVQAEWTEFRGPSGQGFVGNAMVPLTWSETDNFTWKKRIGGHFSASPIATHDRIYLFSEEGDTTVVKAAPQYLELAKSHVDGKLMASPAVIGSTLLLRSDSKLYRIE